MNILLNISNLSLEYNTNNGKLYILDNINFNINEGEKVALVGESGSGKSVLAKSILGIHDSNASITSGYIKYKNQNLDNNIFKKIRGNEISMIFQSPQTSLNPIRKVGIQISDIIQTHENLNKHDVFEKALKMINDVKIPDAEKYYHYFPYQLSGGMCQRIMIAMALSCSPQLLIADEPTTGLDVTTQAEIIDLLNFLTNKNNMSTLFITHDLALANQFCNRIIVMHAGQIAENGLSQSLIQNPRHPYTKELISTSPSQVNNLKSLQHSSGTTTNLFIDDHKCRFYNRCFNKIKNCVQDELKIKNINTEHAISCHNPL